MKNEVKQIFKEQQFQTDAVEAVINVFKDQARQMTQQITEQKGILFDGTLSFANAKITLTNEQILQNIKNVQQQNNLYKANEILNRETESYNIDVEMETGTGKTFTYFKSIYELNENYGWKKFIIIVPNIAIREGVLKSFRDTKDYFNEYYEAAETANCFIFNSKELINIKNYFIGSDTIQIMIINMQAFNSNSENSDFQIIRRRGYEIFKKESSAIKEIAKINPILILDEPQKIEGEKTSLAIKDFNPLFILRYSATHNTLHNLVYRLDAVDAFQKRLVKRIKVVDIGVKNYAGTDGFIKLLKINTKKNEPIDAEILIDVKKNKGGDIERKKLKIKQNDNLFAKSNDLEKYKNNFIVTQINAGQGYVEFKNGKKIEVEDYLEDSIVESIRKTQIRQTIKEHLEKESKLFEQGIKVLSLFFIDTVVKYRDYDKEDKKGVYAKWFEEIYREEVENFANKSNEYKMYLQNIKPEETHSGYFSIDKGGNLKNPEIDKNGISKDTKAYDLILKNKGRLLSLNEPVRFIFSHSALGVGWDNPNVFQICMLKFANYENENSRRQEIGRGLRLCVNENGNRMDTEQVGLNTVHDINLLSIIASEDGKDFIEGVQNEYIKAMKSRQKCVTKELFTEAGYNEDEAGNIISYLNFNGYINGKGEKQSSYSNARNNLNMNPFQPQIAHLQNNAEKIFRIIDGVFDPNIAQKMAGGGSKLPLKFAPNLKITSSQDFLNAWKQINQNATYSVDIKTDDLIKNSIQILNENLNINPAQIIITKNKQEQNLEFSLEYNDIESAPQIISTTPINLLAKIAKNTKLKRESIIEILKGITIEKLKLIEINPEKFIAEVSFLITEARNELIVQHIKYTIIQGAVILKKAIPVEIDKEIGDNAIHTPNKHALDYAIISSDSTPEKEFAKKADTSQKIEAFYKLPSEYKIPTPFKDYNPDWLVVYKKEDGQKKLKSAILVAETKSTKNEAKYRLEEKRKIDAGKAFYEELKVDYKYGSPEDFSQLF